MQVNKIGLLAAQLNSMQKVRLSSVEKAAEYKANKSSDKETTEEKTSSSSSTSSSGSEETKSYEILEQAAAKVQEYAAKLKELGSDTSEETEEKKFKESALDYVEELVEAYNELYKEMQDMGDETNLIHCEYLSGVCESYASSIGQLGITKEKGGTLTVDKEQAENITVEAITASAAWLQAISDRCSAIESAAGISIKLWNSLYGTSSYTGMGTSSTYYGDNGSLYSAIV